ncbi:hypothetical protein [Halobacillus sp. B29]|uniref:hypothetical protein n=1 Tax=Halobacillus sp. B29 TaxID=3457432 RepID=UPI003FCC3CE0
MFKEEIDKILKENSLYDGYVITSNNYQLLEDMFTEEVVIDTYCVDCEKESTFKANLHGSQLKTLNGVTFKGFNQSFIFTPPDDEGIVKEEYYIDNFWNKLAPFTLTFTCQRNEKHKMYFMFIFRDDALMKIGQYPSTATLDNADLQKYRKILDNEKYKEFSKGVGLASHGVGIGSFVYLRRIFEDLIEDSHQKARAEKTEWDEEKYKQSRMNGRIKLLEDYLPAFLVEHSELYGILSKGVHELEEDTCLSMFPNIQLAIEIILDEKIKEKERESKINKASRFIKETHESFK